MRRKNFTKMKVFGTLLTGALTLLAWAQMRDDFDGSFNSSLPWQWIVPGNTPYNTEDPAHYSFSSSTLDIVMQPGTLTLADNNAHNILTLRVGPAQRGWYIETRLTLDLSGASGAWIQAGLIWLLHADHYYTYHLVLNPFNGNLFLGTAHEESGSFITGGAQSGEWSPSLNTVTLRMQDYLDGALGSYVEIWYDNGDGNGMRWLITVPTASVPGWPFTVLRDVLLNGGRIGIYTDSSGYSGEFMPMASFDYFETNLPILPAGDVNGDCIVDDADLLAVLFAFGQTGAGLMEDVNGDEVVDDADLLTVLFTFGSRCGS